jgi:hypothetical protein
MQELRNYLGLRPYNELFLPSIHFNPILHWRYKKCTSENREKIHGGPLRVWDPRTKTKPWFPPHMADIDGTTSFTYIWKGGLGNSQKIKKNEKHCME